MNASPSWLSLSRQEAHKFYARKLKEAKAHGMEQLRLTFYEIGRHDLYFFLCYILEQVNYPWLDNDWTFQKCRLVQSAPWGFADFWPRGHMKTTIITVGYTLWESLYFPETTTGIFMMVQRQYLKVAGQIMAYLELDHVKWIFKDVLWENPSRDSRGWNAQAGLYFRRESTAREATIEFHSILSLPTGTHLQRHRLDDIVDQKYVTNQEMVEKALNNVRLMTPLRTMDGLSGLAGTRYGNLDAYHFLLEQESYIPRVFTPTDNGEIDGRLLLMTQEQFARWCKDLGPYQVACQMFQKPQNLSLRQFDSGWIQWWNAPDQWSSMNRYIIVDPASKKGKGNDFTAIAVVGLGADQNVYLIDAVRDQLDPSERADTLVALVMQYKPKAVFYEESGMSADVHHLRTLMDRKQYHFNLYPVQAGGNKAARIETLQPLAKDGRLWMPKRLDRVSSEGAMYDVVQDFVRYEWTQWPKPTHDDLLDALCRVTDGSTTEDRKKFPIPIEFPKERTPVHRVVASPTRYDPATNRRI